jgi:hypothetical protein
MLWLFCMGWWMPSATSSCHSKLYPGQRAFTHVAHHGTGASAARLDRWYASASLLPWVLVEGLPGVHTAVSLTLAPEEALPCGAGRWRLPLHLLQERRYCSLVHQRPAVP